MLALGGVIATEVIVSTRKDRRHRNYATRHRVQCVVSHPALRVSRDHDWSRDVTLRVTKRIPPPRKGCVFFFFFHRSATAWVNDRIRENSSRLHGHLTDDGTPVGVSAVGAPRSRPTRLAAGTIAVRRGWSSQLLPTSSCLGLSRIKLS